MRDLSGFLVDLAEKCHAQGGWGYGPGLEPQAEPTCFGLLALTLQPERFSRQIAGARAFLDRCAFSDGSYRLARSRDEAVWPTSLVLFVQDVVGYPPETIRRTAARLLQIRGQVPDKAEVGELHDIDLRLVGWPWGEGNFSWVEPTAWACLALRRVGLGQHPRVQEGIRMLLDRAMDDGGINYGNRKVLGLMTEPIPGPTALFLLAVQGIEHPRINAAVSYLAKLTACGDLEFLSWIKLALDAHRETPGVSEVLDKLDGIILEALETRRHTSWLKDAYMRQALMILALATDRGNPFRLPAEVRTLDRLDVPQAGGARAPLTQRLGSWFRGLAVKAAGQFRPLPLQSKVHIARAADYDADLASILKRQYEHFRSQTPIAGKRVVLKPNLVEYHRDKVINTNPKVVSAVIDLCKSEGAREIIVAEGPGHWRNVEFLVQESGLGDVLKKHGVPFVDLNHDEPIKTPNLGRLTGMEYLFLARTVAEAEVFISLPKLKTHHWAGATLSLKNLFGILPGICYGWPKNELHWRGIENSIVDIALTRTPDLAIVDGIVAMEGDGPLNGTAKPFGALVMGNDLVAVDGTCCRLMQLDPEKIGYLVLGQMKKLGRLKEGEIQQVGEAIATLTQPFATIPHLEHLKVRRSA